MWRRDLIHLRVWSDDDAMFKLNFRLIHGRGVERQKLFLFLLVAISMCRSRLRVSAKRGEREASRRKKSFRCHKTHTGQCEERGSKGSHEIGYPTSFEVLDNFLQLSFLLRRQNTFFLTTLLRRVQLFVALSQKKKSLKK